MVFATENNYYNCLCLHYSSYLISIDKVDQSPSLAINWHKSKLFQCTFQLNIVCNVGFERVLHILYHLVFRMPEKVYKWWIKFIKNEIVYFGVLCMEERKPEYPIGWVSFVMKWKAFCILPLLIIQINWANDKFNGFDVIICYFVMSSMYCVSSIFIWYIFFC